MKRTIPAQCFSQIPSMLRDYNHFSLIDVKQECGFLSVEQTLADLLEATEKYVIFK